MIRALLACIALCAASAAVDAKQLQVVATFSILGDMVQCVAAGRARLTTLVGPDADTHLFEPTPGHARALNAAELIFANGLGFEPWLARLMKSTASRARLVNATGGLKHLRAKDPHAWQDPANGRTYLENIRDALIQADPANALAYRTRAGMCIADLAAAGRESRAAFAAIPKAQRRVITSHDAFGYLAAAYDVEFVAPLGTSTEAQASAKGVARLIAQIKREKIRAVFVENISDPRLIEQIARETGARIGGKLYSDALSAKGGPAPTYAAMIRHNAKLLTGAMAQGF